VGALAGPGGPGVGDPELPCAEHVCEDVGLVVGVVTGADERAGLDDLEPAAEPLALEHVEGVGVDPAVDGQVVACGLEVLADGEDVAGGSWGVPEVRNF
jgi:hypothetical protein